MPKPRKQLISLNATPYYHCTSRCVRRAFLCGYDKLTDTSYEHRRQWIEDRILFLASVFAIDVCAYAVMSNHHHVVLHINSAEAQSLTDHDVCERWHQIYKGTLLTQKYLKGETLEKSEWEAVKLKLDQWRLQLYDISWFMRALNEPIARQANDEDSCTGRFWESRFKSQALLDDKALLACVAYVDLNPIRAKMADTPEGSDHTSIKKRIDTLTTQKEKEKEKKAENTKEHTLELAQFVGNPREPMPIGLPFHLQDYIELVDITGRVIREDKRGHIDNNLPSILDRLDIDETTWLTLTTQFEAQFKSLVGSNEKINQAAVIFGYQRRPGLANCQALFH